ncbi:MAG: polysaccharide deacetylase family protein, partial [Ruminococcus sp.]|nr:polysaccharide deacetylase family protein [Ruminococcus sp.]
TFDDGSYNNLTYVLPLLEKYDFKATFSIVGSFSEYACEEAEPSPAYSYLDWNDMIKMQKSKRCEFANHTYDLHSLTDRRGCLMKNGETYEQFRHVFLADVFKTQHLLEDNCNIKPKVFAYPYGLRCDAAERLVKNSGFLASLCTEERINKITVGDNTCLYNLGRVNRPAFVDTESFMKEHDID